MSSISNDLLSEFKYGIYKDNALTYFMRIKDQEIFKYLLLWGILPSSSNDDGMTSVHFAVEMEGFEFLGYMLQGDFDKFKQNEKSMIEDSPLS